MNSRRYDIVKSFLLMGNSLKTISESFKCSLADVQIVSRTDNFRQYREERYTDMGDFMNTILGGVK